MKYWFVMLVLQCKIIIYSNYSMTLKWYSILLRRRVVFSYFSWIGHNAELNLAGIICSVSSANCIDNLSYWEWHRCLILVASWYYALNCLSSFGTCGWLSFFRINFLMSNYIYFYSRKIIFILQFDFSTYLTNKRTVRILNIINV